MRSDWPLVALSEVTSVLGDGLHGTPSYNADGDYYFINGNNLNSGKIVFDEKTKRCDHNEFLKHRKPLNDRTVLVSINGTLGNVAYYNEEKVILGKSACYFNVAEGIDKKFIRYIVSGPLFQKYLESISTGTTIKNVSLRSMRDFSFNLPPLDQQIIISEVLGSLDDKIELNRRMIETLEEMARALFRDWFVDFGPTRRQMEGAADPAAIMGHAFPSEKAATLAPLFPARLSDDGLPEGWEARPLSKICKFTGGSAFKKEYQGREYGEVPFIKVSDMNLTNNERFILSSQNYVDRSDQTQMKFKLHAEGAIVLAKIGVALTYNRLRILRTPTAIDNNLLSATPIDGAATTTFLFLVLSQIDFNLHAKGSALPYLNASDLAKIEFNFASEALATETDKTIGTLFEKVLATSRENQTLAEMRDLLLPKLMSGEIRLKDVEVAV